MKGVVVGYPHQWHWVLTAEYSLNRPDEQIVVFDFGNLGLLSIQSPNFPLSNNWRFRRRAIKRLRAEGITVLVRKFDFIRQLKSIYAALIMKFPITIDEQEMTFKSIYPSLVNDLGYTRVRTKQFMTKIRLEYAKSVLIQARLEGLGKYSLGSLVTINGRFTNNFEVRLFAEKNGLSLTLLEFGATKNSIEEYFTSPHSFVELSQKMKNHWKGDTREKQIARKFFEELSGFDRTAGVSWTRNMVPGLLPSLSSDRRLCIFYASNQKEFAGVGDNPISGHFRTQFEAFAALHSELSKSGGWDIYIRRHPSLKASSLDVDGYYWDKFRNYEHTFFIDPDSTVDSFALGMKAELVAHFNSSIGIQLIYSGHRSVLTMGNAMWANLVPETLGRSIDELRSFLLNPTQDWHQDSVLPWAYFRATFGSEFKFFNFNSKSTTWRFKNFGN